MPASLLSCTLCIWDRAYCLKCQKDRLRAYSESGQVITPAGCIDFKDMRDFRTFCRAGGL
ncbi:MAG: hypothetical protein ACC612_11350 [Methanomethylovorans sp.]|uniref:hypothetical protein n=1 Tax=Methanomethylovorans sp. TaxID=2758717 RepID=UPI0035316B15